MTWITFNFRIMQSLKLTDFIIIIKFIDMIFIIISMNVHICTHICAHTDVHIHWCPYLYTTNTYIMETLKDVNKRKNIPLYFLLTREFKCKEPYFWTKNALKYLSVKYHWVGSGSKSDMWKIMLKTCFFSFLKTALVHSQYTKRCAYKR